MPAPFQSYLDPSVGQYGIPSATAYGTGDQNPNPNPVMSSAANPLGWSNYQTQAPWGSNPNDSVGYYAGQVASGESTKGYNPWTNFGSGNLWNTFMGIGSSKKWSMPDISSPSYQGMLFNPDTGPYAQNYGYQSNQSPQVYAQNNYAPATPSSSYTPVNAQSSGQPSGQYGPSYEGAGGLQGTQSYIGQSPYSVAGGTYVPSQGGGLSYGGYSNYGGYGNSNVGTQPYFPGQ